jgi:RNA polymerase sigma factor (sigma-70 family)
MTAFLERESASDLDLISAARNGDDEAVAELYLRHHDAAARYARGLADPTTAEDLVAEAFAKLLESIRAGGGPSQAFRPYLLRTVHNVYVNHVRRDSRHVWVEDADDLDVPVPDSVDQRRESAVLAEAFASLPERWQAVLWHTAVEGEDHETVGRMLGLKANAVAALAFRSRDGLRRAYLEAHLGATRDEACRPYREQLAPYARGRVRGRRRQRIEEHLTKCPDCTAGYLELGAIGSDLGAVLAPAVLGVTAAGYAGASAGIGGGGAVAALLRGRSLRTSLAAAAAAAVVVAVAAGGFALVVGRGGPDGTVTADPPGAVVATSDPSTGAPAAPPADSPDPSRTDPVVTSTGSLPTASTTTIPVVVPTRSPSGRPHPTSRPPTSSPAPTGSPSPTATPTVSPSIPPSVTPTVTPTETPTETPTPTPTVTPTVDPTTHEDLAIGSGSHAYYGPHHHVQMSVTALLDPTTLTIDVRGLQSFTVHTESTYLAATCAQTGLDGDATELSCQIAAGQGTFAIDVVVSGQLDVVARVSAADNVDPNPANDELVFQS